MSVEAWAVDPDGTTLNTDADVDAMIDEMLAGTGEWSVAALYHSARPPNARGLPDHELRVVARTGYGGVQYRGHVDGSPGQWYAAGDTAAEAEVLHYYFGHDEEWPADSVVPVGAVRAAVKEFLASGGERPTGVEWKPWT